MSTDFMTEEKLKFLYPDIATRVVRFYGDIQRITGRVLRITETLRNLEAQNKRYAQGRTEPGPIVTHARPGDSLHHYGLAFDSCVAGGNPYLDKDPDQDHFWSEFGRMAGAHGLKWGGNFRGLPDRPHCELSYGLSLPLIKELYRTNGLFAIWTEIDKVRGVEPGSEWAGPDRRARLLEFGEKLSDTM